MSRCSTPGRSSDGSRSPGESEGVNALDFGPDGTRLAAGYADGTVVVWDLPTRSQVHTFRGHAKEVTDLAFNPDGQDPLLASLPTGCSSPGTSTGTRGFPGWRSFPAQPGGVDLARSIPSPDGTKVLYQAYNHSIWTPEHPVPRPGDG